MRGTTRDPAQPRRVPSWAGNLLLLALSVGLALGLGELAVRLVRPQQLRHLGPIYRPADTIGFERLPNLRTRANLGDRWVEVLTDQDGFRVGRAGRIEADTRVLLLGDSFVEALGVPYEESFAGLLQERLPARLGRAVAVRNGGVSGYSPSHYLLAAERALARERFDLAVVALFLGNDLVSDSSRYHRPFYRARAPRPRAPHRWTFTEFNRAVVLPIMLRLVARSHLAALVWNETDLFRARLGLLEWQFPGGVLRERADGKEWALTARFCRAINDLVTAQGGRAIFLLLPERLQVDPHLLHRYASALGVDTAGVDPEQPNRLLGAELARGGLVVLDALAELRKAYAAGREVYGKVDLHLGRAGHAVVADLLEPAITQALAAGGKPAAGR